MGTARQVELLRTEVGQVLQSGLQELRSANHALRSELLTAITEGLRENREELRRALGREQRELAEARKEIRDLRQQFDEARASQGTALPDREVPGPEAERTASLPHSGSVSWRPAVAAGHSGDTPSHGEQNLPNRQDDSVTAGGAPTPEGEPRSSPLPDRAAHPTESVKEAPVPEQDNPTPDSAEQQRAADMAAALSAVGRQGTDHRLRPDAPAAPAESPVPRAMDRDRLEASLFHTLVEAARISAAELVCHPHTWQFIAACAATAEHFQLPATDKGEDDMITVRLSGRSLVATVNALYKSYWDASPGLDSIQDRALALAYYTDICHEVSQVRPALSRSEATEPVDRPRTRIVIDYRPRQNIA